MPDKITRDTAIFETMQALRRIVRAIQDYSHEVSHNFGVTGPQLWAMKTIFQNDGISLGELSRKMYLHPSTISGVMDRLENKGYAVRYRNNADRRVVTVKLTPAGESLVKKAPNPAQGKLIHGLMNLDDDDLKNIYESVQRLVDIMEAQNLKVTFFFDQEEAGPK